MKYVKILLFITSILAIGKADAQSLKSRIAKIGFSSDFMPFQEKGNFSLHLDIENSTVNNFITNEYALGFMRDDSDLYYVKFDYKFYPVSAILNNFKYQGLYLSLGPGIYYEDLAGNKSNAGLGLFTTAGVQFLLNNRFSFAVEVEMDLVSNLVSEGNSADNNKFFSNSIKVGYVFNRNKK